MPKFIPYDPKQSKRVVINYSDQLQPGTFEFAINHIIDHKLDLTIFYPRYQNDEGGRPACDPAILLKIILFAYSKGITSSREIQWCCETNILFKALSCDTVPHDSTLARFVSGRSEEIEALFEQVLLICDAQGLSGKEQFALDGCKMSSNAAKEWSGTFKELEQKRDKIQRQIHYVLNEQKKHDSAGTREDQRRARSEQAIETLNKAHEKIDRFLKTARPRMGQGKITREVKSNSTDNESAKMTTSKGTIQGDNGIATVDKKHQIIVDAQAFGEGQEHHTLQPVLNAVFERFKRLGIDTHNPIVTADTGYANEANNRYRYDNHIDAYIPDNPFRQRDPKFSEQQNTHSQRKAITGKKLPTKGVIPPSAFDFNPASKTCRCPAGEMMWLRSELIDKHGHTKIFFEGRLTKCRGCELKHRCMRNPDSANTRKDHGRQVSFIIQKGQRVTNYTDWMKRRVDSERGKLIYSHRMSVVEPVFGNIGANKRLSRFSLRGKKKVQGQWQLYCLIHNIEKLKNVGELAR